MTRVVSYEGSSVALYNVPFHLTIILDGVSPLRTIGCLHPVGLYTILPIIAVNKLLLRLLYLPLTLPSYPPVSLTPAHGDGLDAHRVDNHHRRVHKQDSLCMPKARRRLAAVARAVPRHTTEQQ
jgi:hypothetical protein